MLGSTKILILGKKSYKMVKNKTKKHCLKEERHGLLNQES